MLCDKLILSSIVVTGFNDSYLKYSALAGPVTGKLSDVCGLFFFPFFLYSLIELGFPLRTSRLRICVFTGLCFLTGGFFGALQLSSDCVAFYKWSHELLDVTVRVTQDPTDLFALPVLFLSILHFKKLR